MNSQAPGWACMAAVIAIALAFAVYYSLIAWFAHRERMAKIQHDPRKAAGEPNVTELADRVIALERELDRLRPEKSPVTEIKKSHPN